MTSLWHCHEWHEISLSLWLCLAFWGPPSARPGPQTLAYLCLPCTFFLFDMRWKFQSVSEAPAAGVFTIYFGRVWHQLLSSHHREKCFRSKEQPHCISACSLSGIQYRLTVLLQCRPLFPNPGTGHCHYDQAQARYCTVPTLSHTLERSTVIVTSLEAFHFWWKCCEPTSLRIKWLCCDEVGWLRLELQTECRLLMYKSESDWLWHSAGWITVCFPLSLSSKLTWV